MILTYALLGFLAAAFATWGWRSHPVAMTTVALFLAFAEGVYGSFNAVSVLGIQIYPGDVLWGAALIAAALLRKEWGPVDRRLGWILGLMVVSLVLGAIEFGLTTATNDFRYFLYFFAALVYYSTFPFRPEARACVRRGLVILGTALAGVAYAYWLQNGVGGSTSATRELSPNAVFAGATRDGRALPVAETAIIAQAFFLIVLLPNEVRSRFVRLGLAISLVIAVVLLQHRTIWVAAILAASFGLLAHGSGRPKLARWMATGTLAVLGSLAYTVAAWLGLGATSVVAESGQAAFAGDSTFIWRIRSWEALLTQSRPVWEWLVGSPFGSGYGREIAVGSFTGAVDVNPHSYYVQIALRLGILGLVAFGWLLFRCIRSTFVAQHPEGPVLVAMTVVVLCLCVTYPPTYVQGIILGLVVSWQHRVRGSRGEGDTDAHRNLYHYAQ